MQHFAPFAFIDPTHGAIQVRPALRREIPEISALIAEAIGAYRGHAPDAVLRPYIALSRDVAARWDHGKVLVALQYGRVVGTVTFYDDGSIVGLPSDWTSFGTLAVHPRMQRRGIGSSLVRRCVAAATHVAPTIGIRSGRFMRDARQLYESMGFVRSPEHDIHASEVIAIEPAKADVDLLAYRLDLDDAFSG